MRDFIIPWLARLRITRLWRKLAPSSMPVLLLHGVLPEEDSRFFNSTGKFLTPGQLAEVVKWMSSIYDILPLEDVCLALIEGRALKNVTALTFDDGYANNHDYAFPVLKEMHVPFTIFLSTGFIDTDFTMWNDKVELAVSTAQPGRTVGALLPAPLTLRTEADRQAAVTGLKEALKSMPADKVGAAVEGLYEELRVDPRHPALGNVRFMTSAQIAEMSEWGVTFGSHTVTHPILSRESLGRVRAELRDSKAWIESLTGRDVRLFAYPNGRYEDFNEAVKQELRDAGYTAALTTVPGLAAPGDDPFEIRRISADGRWSHEMFEARVSGVLSAIR
jgi:peptidoglycan/xylan/chitin deacetylase (PgdA/CDA1 family)